MATSTAPLRSLQIVGRKLVVIGIDQAIVQRIEEPSERLSYVPIVRPVSCIVTHAEVRIGQMVSPAEHLHDVVNSTTLWIFGEVLESDVRLGTRSRTINALPVQRMPGK